MGVDHGVMWQSSELSHIDVEIRASKEQGSTFISRMPGHSSILAASPYLFSMVKRWIPSTSSSSTSRPRKRQCIMYKCDDVAKDIRSDAGESHGHDQVEQQPTLVLTLESEQQEDVVMKLLAALYGMKPPYQDMTHEELLQLIILADKWGVKRVVDKGISTLRAAAEKAAEGLSIEAKQLLLGMHAFPDCLQSAYLQLEKGLKLQDAAQLWSRLCAPSSSAGLEAVQAATFSTHMQNRLLQELGDLEAVWRDDTQKQQLLCGLPLPAMQLLLSSSQLQVASEDTVLCTAQAYTDAETHPVLKEAARQQLGQLVRCPYLRESWLLAVATADCATSVLDPLKVQIGWLLRFQAECPDFNSNSERFKAMVDDVPASWLLGGRQHKQVPSSVDITWKLPVSKLQEVCNNAAGKKGVTIRLACKELSPPLRGQVFQLRVEAQPAPQRGLGTSPGCSLGSQLGVYIVPMGAATHMFSCVDVTVTAGPAGPAAGDDAPEASKLERHAKQSIMKTGRGWGFCNFFGLGTLMRGWDEAAWNATGLPKTGELELKATISFTKPADSSTGS